MLRKVAGAHVDRNLARMTARPDDPSATPGCARSTSKRRRGNCEVTDPLRSRNARNGLGSGHPRAPAHFPPGYSGPRTWQVHDDSRRRHRVRQPAPQAPRLAWPQHPPQSGDEDPLCLQRDSHRAPSPRFSPLGLASHPVAAGGVTPSERRARPHLLSRPQDAPGLGIPEAVFWAFWAVSQAV